MGLKSYIYVYMYVFLFYWTYKHKVFIGRLEFVYIIQIIELDTVSP